MEWIDKKKKSNRCFANEHVVLKAAVFFICFSLVIRYFFRKSRVNDNELKELRDENNAFKMQSRMSLSRSNSFRGDGCMFIARSNGRYATYDAYVSISSSRGVSVSRVTKDIVRLLASLYGVLAVNYFFRILFRF
jgi:hypothetical protein